MSANMSQSCPIYKRAGGASEFSFSLLLRTRLRAIFSSLAPTRRTFFCARCACPPPFRPLSAFPLAPLTLLFRRYSFIIDDGAHTPDSQMAAFNHLFKTALEDGGTYFIEDIETSYWTTGSLYGNEYRGGGRGNGEEGQNVIEIFKALADAVNKEFFTASGLAEEDVPFIDPEVAGMVESVEFGANLVAITKREEERHAFYHDRAYRMSDYVEGYGA